VNADVSSVAAGRVNGQLFAKQDRRNNFMDGCRVCVCVVRGLGCVFSVRGVCLGLGCVCVFRVRVCVCV